MLMALGSKSSGKIDKPDPAPHELVAASTRCRNAMARKHRREHLIVVHRSKVVVGFRVHPHSTTAQLTTTWLDSSPGCLFR